jgi:hypothetical protein
MDLSNLNIPGGPRRRRRPGPRTTATGAIIAILVVVIGAWNQRQAARHGASNGRGTPTAGTSGHSKPSSSAPSAIGSSGRGCAADLKSALDDRRSDVLVECSGDIIKVLDDDNDGARHQRFLVKLDNGVVIKVAHNIDLAPRVPAEEGDLLEFKGEFEWNELGGVVHWTHHDPGGRRQGGWLRLRGKTYD